MKPNLTFAALLLSTSLLHADLIKVGTGAKAVEWVFDLKGSNGAFKVMVDQYFKSAKPAKTAVSGKTAQPSEHVYVRFGVWTVHYYTNSKGKFASASMIRFYDNGDMLRLTSDPTHFHLDTLADLKQLAGGAKDNLPATSLSPLAVMKHLTTTA